jgi:hypothetical protein
MYLIYREWSVYCAEVSILAEYKIVFVASGVDSSVKILY